MSPDFGLNFIALIAPAESIPSVGKIVWADHCGAKASAAIQANYSVRWHGSNSPTARGKYSGTTLTKNISYSTMLC